MAALSFTLESLRAAPARFARWFRANWRHPAMILPGLILLTQVLGEFYPFSHFPMYSNPNVEPSTYIYVVDADEAEAGKMVPVAMEHVFGVRAARAKKIYYAWLKDRAKELGFRDRHDLHPEQREEIARKLLAFFRKRSEAIGETGQLPERIALVMVEIAPELGVALQRRESLITSES